MKRLLCCAAVSLSVLTLAACASQGGMGYQSAPPRIQQADGFERDAAYISAVERTARMRGIDVRWVNPPVRRVARNDEHPSQ